MPTPRTQWRLAAASFAIAMLGLIILFTPTLEFAALDLFAHFGRAAHTLMNLALLTELCLLLGGALGLLVLLTRKLFIR